MTESSDAAQEATAPPPTDGAWDGAAAMRSVYQQVDWSATALGPQETWPALLRLVADLCLDSDSPVLIGWGPDLLMLYNEAYIPLLGAEKHPWALGRPASEVKPRLWPAEEERVHEIMQTGRPYHLDDQLLIIERRAIPRRRTSASPSAPSEMPTARSLAFLLPFPSRHGTFSTSGACRHFADSVRSRSPRMIRWLRPAEPPWR